MPAELTTSESYRQDLVDTGIVIRTESLVKTTRWARNRCTRCKAWIWKSAKANT